MFDSFFFYFPIIFVAFILYQLFCKAWEKRELVRTIFNQQKTEYYKNTALAKPFSKINFIHVFINLIWAAYNLYLFFTDFSNETVVLINFWVSFFLLLLNFPLFIYHDEKKKEKTIPLIMFICISLCCFSILFYYNGLDFINLIIGWFYNYIILLFFSNKKAIDYVKGKTAFFILFWLFILVVSIFIDVNFDLPSKYNYGFLINFVYFLTHAYFCFFSSKYENIENK